MKYLIFLILFIGCQQEEIIEINCPHTITIVNEDKMHIQIVSDLPQLEMCYTTLDGDRFCQWRKKRYYNCKSFPYSTKIEIYAEQYCEYNF